MIKNIARTSLCALAIATSNAFSQQYEKEFDSIVERGQYLATAGNCHSCHTSPGGDPFSGGVAFTTDFGVIYSTNITSDKASGIGNWTEKEFSRALREGISADGSHLYPVFPYTSFARTTDSDISALWAYISSVTPSQYTPPENSLRFPYKYRGLLTIWKALYLNSSPFKEDSSKSDDYNRGAYLVEGLAHCGSCHTPRNALGAEQSDLALSGGTYNDTVDSGKLRPWAAVNLTPAQDGLGHWSKKDISSYLKTGHSNAAGTFGPMNKVITGNTSQLTKQDIDSIAVYLTEIEPIQRSTKSRMNSKDFNKAELLYTIHCGTCHLPTGLGDPSVGPMLAGSAIVQAENPASLINTIIYGATVPKPAPAKSWKSMEAFGDKLDDEEIALLATYLRSNWSNFGSQVTETDVANQR
jgi:mono/diheme cytochrome c family protein